MDELLEQFLIEGRDLVAHASSDFSLLANDPANVDALDSAFRSIHTLKGSVAIFDMAPAERILHAAEDLLGQARRGSKALAPKDIEALVSCLDKVDRWIDDMGERGQLPLSASRESEDVLGLLKRELPSAEAVDESACKDERPEWLELLVDRHVEMIGATTTPLVAFRYAPDADCFFRGDDPLAIVSGLPDLLALDMAPLSGTWPAPNDLDPFSCLSLFEGLSAASREQVMAAFRLIPDQVVMQVVDARQIGQDQPANLRESRASNQMRVDVARVEAMADSLGELIVAINSITPVAEDIGKSDPQLASTLRKTQASLERVTGQLHRTVNTVRSVPLEPALRRLPRLAREIADSVGKRVSFNMVTGGLEVDKQIADGLFEPVLHLLRNAIDHGIEMPEARAASQKSADGQITLSARRDGDAISINLSDDGAGIDPMIIKQRALEREIIDPQEAELLTDVAALQLIFVAGFSTAEVVTEISGRGVGMDAVQEAVARLRGTIDVSSEKGKGTTFRLRLPTDSLTTRLLVIEVAGERYGVALDQVLETIRVERAALLPVGPGWALVLRGRTVPVLSLAELLGYSEQDAGTVKLVVTQSGGETVALSVDGFAERIDTVVRPTRGVLAVVPSVMGSALLGNGDVLLVLDLPELAS